VSRLIDPIELLSTILRRGGTIELAIELIVRHLHSGDLVQGIIVRPGGDIRGLPRPACIEAHLPVGRKPSDDELRRAWDLCKGN
jgi:hypothetical protein